MSSAEWNRRIYWSWYWYYYRRVHSRAALLHRLGNDQSRPGHKFQSCTTNKWQHVVSGSSRCGDGVANMFLMSVCVMTLRLPRPEHSPTLDKRSSYPGPLGTGLVSSSWYRDNCSSKLCMCGVVTGVTRTCTSGHDCQQITLWHANLAPIQSIRFLELRIRVKFEQN